MILCFYCDPQIIPELKQQVSELQRQKQELEGIVKEQSRDLAGFFLPLLLSKNLTINIFCS